MTSFGIIPENPDDYYLKLCQGKKWFDITQAMVKKSFGTFEWWGWTQYRADYKGNRWVLKYLMSWYNEDLPKWLTSENEEIDFK